MVNKYIKRRGRGLVGQYAKLWLMGRFGDFEESQSRCLYTFPGGLGLWHRDGADFYYFTLGFIFKVILFLRYSTLFYPLF